MWPTECKYCGCEEVATKTESEIVFRCWSSYVVEDDHWTVSNNCGARCAVQLVELRANVQRAVEVLERATRFDVISWDGGVCRDPSDGGGEVDADIVDQVIEILKGNSPESPDSSPVTAGQLATADYYEAVRQRVPWMTSVQHIEELVDGYRQCGLMVWKAAKHIEDLFGGEHGQTK